MRDKETDLLWARLGGELRPDGVRRLTILAMVLRDAEAWADDAARSTHVPGTFLDHKDPDDPSSPLVKKGETKQRNWEAEEAVFSLAAIWTEQVGKPPTIISRIRESAKSGPFLDSCAAVISPVYKSHDLNLPSVQAAAQKVLYPARDKDAR